ncbi:NgoPII family restriction endonuclease [Vibrio parahaemolyticus]|uniref:NgoPII family restriction endonuclease n=1 Tax=Vibrio parahaemolyticus TaxID=670 RepID=UPI003891F6AE
MRSNILKAILKLSNQIQRDLPETEMTSNRIQYVGNSLEEYIRNAFLDEEQQVNSTFSYLGAKNSPPQI